MDLERASYAGLGRRSAAYLLDLVVSLSPIILAGIALRILRAVGAWTPAGAGGELAPEELWHALGTIAKLSVIFAFVLSTGLVYFALFESSPWQATLGKRLLDVHVTGDDRARIGIARSFGRSVARCVLNSFGLVLVSVLTILATNKGKALHDFAAKTLVVRGRPSPGGPLELWRMAVGFGVPFFWTLGTFLATM
jgi:uncharacterized RDD family membrane protein YckC